MAARSATLLWLLLLLLAAALALLAAAAEAGGSGSRRPAPRRILVDTDVDTDDLFAILYLLKQDRAEFDLEVRTVLAYVYVLPPCLLAAWLRSCIRCSELRPANGW